MNNSDLWTNIDTSYEIPDDEHTWSSARDLIQFATATKVKTESFITKCIDLSDAEAGDSEKMSDAAAYNAHQMVRTLNSSGYFELMCGKVATNDALDDIGKIRIFWSSVRMIVSSQFGGLLVEKEFSPQDLADQVVKNDLLPKLVADFWSPPSDATGEPERRTRFNARAYILLSLFSSIAEYLEAKKDRSKKLTGIKSNLRNWLKENRDEVSRAIMNREIDAMLSNDELRLDSDERLKKFHLYQLKKLVRNSGILDYSYDSDEKLFAFLKMLLTRGSDHANTLEVSLLLRILGGRFLNGGVSRCEPWWRNTFIEGIDYVLKRQSSADGKWIDHLPLITQRGTPLLHAFSPLIYLLELGVDILSLRMKELTSAARRSLEKLSDTLDGYMRNLANSGDDLGEFLSSNDLFEKVIIALAVSSVVADRFKDVLSRSVLDKLGAVDPQIDTNWDAMPDALNLKENVEAGVIDEWTNKSSHRPGAILIYGPPGTGKTTLAKLLAMRLNNSARRTDDNLWRFLEFSPADFAREGSNRIVALAEHLFTQLRSVRRCVVLLDEMEEFLRIRSNDSDKDSRLITTAFLPLLQEAVRSREIILVVATNFVGNIDPAVTRRGRFDLILPLGPPDRKSRGKIIEEFLERSPGLLAKLRKTLPEEDFAKSLLSEYTMGYAKAEIEDFLYELDRRIRVRSDHGRDVNDGSMVIADRKDLVIELWRIRCERVPTALSGRAGCSWTAFADEARRYSRYFSGLSKIDQDYWEEPKLPTARDRGIVERWPTEDG